MKMEIINTFNAMDWYVKAIIIIAFTIIALGILYVAICFIKFLFEELNASIKNAKRSFQKPSH